ncbi:methionine--tRNA ligase [Alloacidobacterium sp.]|uniref:methionine--tRNA ligase n=1 Tax=Alloacidobacterium sp. TaxID=2951999 RepID=UPI002D48D7CD|nr:methionine--tRNA ligase [Alloacidobacterium sp.]HYK36197.1 methionine--tRNA ligase [Alloacidobacterium sp.]
MSNPEKFYLTTPIYYVNARPHIGHAYTTIVADAVARRKRALGIDTWFLTGTDEHGQKIERSAQKANCSPQEFTDKVASEFKGLWDRMGLTYDDFIRTTEPRHKQAVQKFFSLLKDRGYIYKGSYTGQYCVFDEAYVDVPPGAPCPDCGRTTETISEENYFFKFSAFERKLLEFYDANPEFIRPETRRNEVISFVRSGLKDLSVSRTSIKWGIPVPGDEKHVIYVWFDALANYITALGYGSDDPGKFEKYWPADLQIIGKEISRFHCVYWPAFLMAAGLPLPKSIVAHGWLLFEESKMSKSRGNIVRAETILEGFGALKPELPNREQDLFGADVLRYFLLREIVFGQDGSFSFDALVQRYNSDLANGYGNLVSRTFAMIARYFSEDYSFGIIRGSVQIPPTEQEGSGVKNIAEETIREASILFDKLDFSRALEKVWALIAFTDGYLTSSAPWKVAASAQAEGRDIPLDVRNILYTAAEAIRIITALVYPVMPDAAAKVWAQLGLGDIKQADLKNLQWGGLKPGTKLGELGPVFPRAEKDAITRMQDIEQQNAKATEAAEPVAPAAPEHHASKLESIIDGLAVAISESTSESSTVAAFTEAIRNDITGGPKEPHATGHATSITSEKITIDDFAKVELRVAQVKVAERIPKADKLLRLEVDLGYETRQILAGIAEAYEPESLIGRKVVIVANLAPRKLRGLESNGMIVAASIGEKGKPVLAGFLEDVEIGARLK